MEQREIVMRLADGDFSGFLSIPKECCGLVLFAHGSGSSRFSRRNTIVARHLQDRRIGTLLFDLLTMDEDRVDKVTSQFRFDIPLLSRRLTEATLCVITQSVTGSLPLGYFGASTGAAAALIAAAEQPTIIKAVVSRGGRPDMAGEALSRVVAPTLLIVGGADEQVIELNIEAQQLMTRAPTKMEIVSGATHLFEEPGALEEVAELATKWFEKHFLMILDKL